MRCELLVAVLFELPLHLVDGFGTERPCGAEHPCAFAASPALKIRPFDPDQFATYRLHGHLATRCGYSFSKDDVALGFDGTAATKTAPSLDLSEILSKAFEHTSKRK